MLGIVLISSVLRSEPSIAKSSLKPPATTLSWMLGDWRCRGYNYDSGTPRLRRDVVEVTFTPGPGGLTVLNRSIVNGHPQYDRITWNEETAHWLDVDEASSGREKLASALTAEDVDVNADGMVFTGFQQMGNVVVRVMIVTTKTGGNSFTQQDEFYEDDDWKTVEMTYCKRVAPTRS